MDGTMKIALETSYDSVGQDMEQVGRTYLRIREVGTFASDTPYPIIKEKLNEVLQHEALRDKKALEHVESASERRKNVQHRP
jgi:hypothetical protein